jgi:hypothetical protein
MRKLSDFSGEKKLFNHTLSQLVGYVCTVEITKPGANPKTSEFTTTTPALQ